MDRSRGWQLRHSCISSLLKTDVRDVNNTPLNIPTSLSLYTHIIHNVTIKINSYACTHSGTGGQEYCFLCCRHGQEERSR